MRNTASGRFSRKHILSDEHIRLKEQLQKQVGTDEFPVCCPLQIMEVPDGYRFWYEMYNLHRQEMKEV